MPTTHAHHINDQLTLKRLNQGNADRLFQLVEQNRTILSQWLSWVPSCTTVSHSSDFIHSMSDAFDDGTMYPYGIFHDDKLIGMIALNKVSRGGVNLTYWLDAHHQGKGTATLGAKYLTEFALTKLGYHRVMIRGATKNIKSRAIPERLGFTYEGIARGDYWLNAEYVDIAVYSFLRSDL